MYIVILGPQAIHNIHYDIYTYIYVMNSLGTEDDTS